MKTYAEEKGKKPFDWNKFLSTNHREKAWDNAYNLAGNWVTCGCGNMCAVIPRDQWGEPMDEKLAAHGLQFAQDIENRDRAGAIATLAKIEKRSAKLIKKINKKNGQAPQEEQSV